MTKIEFSDLIRKITDSQSSESARYAKILRDALRAEHERVYIFKSPEIH
jgi:hypothetical protein